MVSRLAVDLTELVEIVRGRLAGLAGESVEEAVEALRSRVATLRLMRLLAFDFRLRSRSSCEAPRGREGRRERSGEVEGGGSLVTLRTRQRER